MPDTITDRGSLQRRLADFLDGLAAPDPAPAGGAGTAVTLAAAAALAEMAARLSADRIADAADRADRAGVLRARAAGRIDRDGEAYAQVLAADGADERRTALSEAATVPLELAAIGAELAELVVPVATGAAEAVRGDAMAAARLAEAGARVGAELVEINLAGQGDDRVERAADHVAAAAAARSRAERGARRAGDAPPGQVADGGGDA